MRAQMALKAPRSYAHLQQHRLPRPRGFKPIDLRKRGVMQVRRRAGSVAFRNAACKSPPEWNACCPNCMGAPRLRVGPSLARKARPRCRKGALLKSAAHPKPSPSLHNSPPRADRGQRQAILRWVLIVTKALHFCGTALPFRFGCAPCIHGRLRLTRRKGWPELLPHPSYLKQRSSSKFAFGGGGGWRLALATPLPQAGARRGAQPPCPGHRCLQGWHFWWHPAIPSCPGPVT